MNIACHRRHEEFTWRKYSVRRRDGQGLCGECLKQLSFGTFEFLCTHLFLPEQMTLPHYPFASVVPLMGTIICAIHVFAASFDMVSHIL